ncbi:MAG TPA: hypothetical protein VI583_03095, partial [Cyclobacteriaceae bacterium]|nr:hypothetical protein [Cyclobacteriaceae bacterium]
MPGKKLIFFQLIFLVTFVAYGQGSIDTIAVKAQTSAIQTDTVAIQAGIKTPAFTAGSSGKFNIRSILNRLSFSLTTGYGRTFYSHRLQNTHLVMKDPFDTISGLFLIPRPPINAGSNYKFPATKNWLNNPSTFIVPYDS